MADCDYSAEIWRAIPGHDGYEASNAGRIRSVPRLSPFVTRWGDKTDMRVAGRLLRLFPHRKTGYLQVKVTKQNKTKTLQVSRAVCAAFHGLPPTADHQAAHCDGNPLNNRPDNLRWATPTENHADKKRHGTHLEGDKHHNSKLRQRQVEAIRPLRGKVAAKRVAATYGVSMQSIYDIWQGRTWRSCETAREHP